MNEPSVTRSTVIEWLDANDIEVTDRKLDGLFHAAIAAAPAQPVAEPAEVSAVESNTAGAAPNDQMIIEYGIKASRMMARDLTRFDAACEVDKYLREQGAPGYYRHRMSIILFGNDEGTEASRAPENEAPKPSPTPQADGQPSQAEPAPVANLHPKTADLVRRFATALAEKLAEAEKKYGYSDGWASPDWMDECRLKLREHLLKGDPRDVAAYCAFLWHHGESTALPIEEAEQLFRTPERYGSHYPDRIARQERTIADAKTALAGTALAPSKEYAELPKNRCVINTYMLSEDDARAFADATCALRTASHGQAPAGVLEDAARYRALRENEDGVSVACTHNGNTGASPYINGKELDDCADSWLAFNAAITTQKGKT